MSHILSVVGFGLFGGRGKRGVWLRSLAVLSLVAATSVACNENPVDSGIPQVEILMEETVFTVLPLVPATIGLTIANRGPGTAYFEGCSAPVGILVEKFDAATSEWVEHDRPNACAEVETPQTLSLERQQGYAYDVLERTTGSYRVTVFYGSEAGATAAHSAVGPEYAIQ